MGPKDSVVHVGSYPDALGYPFQTANRPGFSFSGDGRGPGSLTATFDVLEIEITDGHLSKFAADFTQYESGFATQWETGSVRYHSDIPITVPEPWTLALLALGGVIAFAVKLS